MLSLWSGRRRAGSRATSCARTSTPSRRRAMSKDKGAGKKKGTGTPRPKPPKKKVEGIGAFTGPGFDSEAVAAAEAGSAKVRGKAAKQIGEPDDRTISINIDRIQSAQRKFDVAHGEAKRLNAAVRNAFKMAKQHGLDVDAL